ncbi:MAG: hypothetical protein IPM63_18270 [Acidobacteriota bacterium]|nr:MAG: hypothetical protein IPM63_18270 [Acidobacteriota bacterium]
MELLKVDWKADTVDLTLQIISAAVMSVLGIPKRSQLPVGTILLLLSFSTITWAQEKSMNEVFRNCETNFGPRVGYSPALFEIDRHYVLSIEFDSEGRLEEVAVEPKYYYEADHPEWEKATDPKRLSQDQVSDLLSRIDRIKPIGTLVKKYDGIIFVTNKTAPFTDEYENASVKFGQVIDLSLPDDAPTQMRYIEVQYKILPQSLKPNP